MPRPLALLTASILLTGCSTPPRVEVGDRVVLDQATADATAGTIVVHVVNPGSEPIELIEYAYTAHVAGQARYQGRHAGEMVLSPGMVRDVPLPVVLGPDISPGTSVMLHGSLQFRGTTTWDETMAEWGYRPTAGFSGQSQVQAGPDQQRLTPGPAH